MENLYYNEEHKNFLEIEDKKIHYKEYFPKQLIDIVNFLTKNNPNLSKPFQDGRINASFNELEVINLIQTKFKIDVPKIRSWYDFSIEENNKFYPVNIKITDTKHPDNLNCKLGIYFALTGLIPDFPNEINWLNFFEKLSDNLGKNQNNDYYFLVINKEETSDVFINSLKGLKSLQPNGNNLPFQCKWKENKKFVSRSFENSKNFLLKNFGSSIKLRAEIYFNFKKYFPEYV